jgi:hypothetical protein
MIFWYRHLKPIIVPELNGDKVRRFIRVVELDNMAKLPELVKRPQY